MARPCYVCGNMSQVFGSNKALDLLVGEVSQSLNDFVNAEFGNAQFNPAVINQASEYLVKHLERTKM